MHRDGCLQMTLRWAGMESLYGQLAASMLLPSHPLCAAPSSVLLASGHSFFFASCPSSRCTAALSRQVGSEGNADAQSHIHLSVTLGECTTRLDRKP